MPYSLFQQQRIDAGQCKDCGGERGDDGTSVFCRACADRHSRRQATRKERLRKEWAQSGTLTCNGCGAVLPDDLYKMCERCREYARVAWNRTNRQRLALKHAAGICVECREPVLPPTRYCRQHWIGTFLRHYRIPPSQNAEFWDKFAGQEFRCYYTGVLLVPGLNASLDHRTPTSRGGSRTDIDNCVWCDIKINAFKNDLTEAEFLERCRAVVARLS
jgi:hypothetical protein